MERGLTIVGLGEALYDVFGERQIVGGAPLNVVVHAQQLAGSLGGRGIPASRIGDDELGRRLSDELAARGISTFSLQRDVERPTGRVVVTLRGGEPSYEIIADTAWDRLEFTDDWKRLAAECGAVCFGTLGQRGERSRATIRQFLRHAPQAIRMFDVNLRQDYFTADVIRQSCELATVVKLNQHELPLVHRLLEQPDATGAEGETQDWQASYLRERFTLDAVVLTRGAAGTVLYDHQGRTEGTPPRYPPHPDADSVGAGDACAAGFLVGMLLDWPAEAIVALANEAGAYVASRPGATPFLSRDLLEQHEGGLANDPNLGIPREADDP